MAAHAVASDTNSVAVEFLEMCEQSFWEFLGDVRIHVVALVPWLLGRVHVETRTGAKIVRIILTLDFQASYQDRLDDGNQHLEPTQHTWAGVWIDHCNALLAGTVLEEALL